MCNNKVIRSASTASELDEIRWWFPDPLFTEEDISLCPASNILRIGFWLPDTKAATLLREGRLWRVWRRYHVPMRRTYLEILHAESFTVEDLHRTEEWMFDGIDYDEQAKHIIVTGVPPVEVTVNVQALEVLITEERLPSGYLVVALNPNRAYYRKPGLVHRC